MAKANANVIEGRARDWGPLFLAFSAGGAPLLGGKAAAAPGAGPGDDSSDAEDDEEEEDEEAAAAADGAAPHEEEAGGGAPRRGRMPLRAWRFALREWLAVLAGLKGLRAVAGAAALRSAVVSHVQDVDPAVQQAALRCLRAFRLPWLVPYADRLLRLADNKTLREELAAFPLAMDPTSTRVGEAMKEGLLPEHRAPVVRLLVRLLYPKMRKRSGRLGGKGESLPGAAFPRCRAPAPSA